MNTIVRRFAIIEGDIALIPIGPNGRDGYAKVDKDLADLDEKSWCMVNGYAGTTLNGKLTYMHHVIYGKPSKGYVIDHINRNRLDNTYANLRQITQAQNRMNSTARQSKSLYKGVSYDKANKKWFTFIKANGKYIWIGRFKHEAEAALAYNTQAIKYHKEFAVLNKVERA